MFSIQNGFRKPKSLIDGVGIMCNVPSALSRLREIELNSKVV